MLSLDSEAAAKLLEHASRMAEDQQKLSIHLGGLGDVGREAQFWATQAQSPVIRGDHVRKAVEQRVYRANLIQERIQEMIARGTLLIDTTGHVPGQVNGLSVLSLGTVAFGKPSRITATVAPGREGVIDIEREVEVGGPLHSKGVLIPEANAVNLMLREDVAEAVADGRFHVWVVRTIDEGIELLTGTPGGERLPEGEFPAGTVNFLVLNTLRRFAESMRRMAEGEEEVTGSARS